MQRGKGRGKEGEPVAGKKEKEENRQVKKNEEERRKHLPK